MKLWPFISKAHHDEVVSDLRSQLRKSEDERKQLLNRVFRLGTGESLFHDPEYVKQVSSDPEPVDETRNGSEETEQISFRRPSMALAHIQRKLDERHSRRQGMVQDDHAARERAAVKIADALTSQKAN